MADALLFKVLSFRPRARRRPRPRRLSNPIQSSMVGHERETNGPLRSTERHQASKHIREPIKNGSLRQIFAFGRL